LQCAPADTSVVLGTGGNMPSNTPSEAGAKYTYNVLNTGNLLYDNISLVNNLYAYINFNYNTGTKTVNLTQDVNQGPGYIAINQ
jgi:hypothetical protein